MSVTMSDEDFDVVRDALRLTASPYSEDQVADVVIAERRARKVIEKYDAERQ